MSTDEIVSIFSGRLRNARLIKGLSISEVSSRLNISRQAYSKYENGSSLPNSKVLIDLHRALNVSIDYLFRKTLFAPPLFEFRKKNQLKKSVIEQLKLQITDHVEKRIGLEDLLNIQVNSDLEALSARLKPIQDFQEISLLAAALRGQWNLGNEPINNIFSLLEKHGIITIKLDAPQGFDGAAAKITEYGNRPVIVVNRLVITERQRLIALHELAHLYLKFNDVEHSQIERLCQVFANEFLLPSARLDELVSERNVISVREIQSLQAEYGLPFDAIVYRLNLMGKLPDANYKRYFTRKNSDPDFKVITEKNIFFEYDSSALEHLVYQALGAAQITITQAAQLLNTSISDLNELGVIG